uniref:Uncharacterized protein n=1 Tax=Anguilla anguilla TaxID=7936 RepID=A0A0E9SX20_ANGAN
MLTTAVYSKFKSNHSEFRPPDGDVDTGHASPRARRTQKR